MYNERSLYYLNQIGIIPWVKKTNSQGGSKYDQNQITTQLLILTPDSLTPNERALLKNILLSLEVSENDWIHQEVSTSPTSNIIAQISLIAAKKALIFGLSRSMIADLNLSDKIELGPLSSYFKNAIAKKQLFSNLMYS